jgi:hypothetical protein
MSKINKLDMDQEKNITSALAKVASLVEGGSSPDDAIVKVASEQKMQAGHVRLMSNAYNTGQSLNTIRGGDSLAEKAAEFPLANALSILDRMFPTTVKTAAAIEHETKVSSDYDLPPTYWLDRRDQQEKQAAAAQVDLRQGLKAPEPYPTDPHNPARRAVSGVRMLQKQAEDRRLYAIGAGYKLVSSLNSLTDYFKTAGHLPIAFVTERAAAVKGQARIVPLMAKVAAQRGSRRNDESIGPTAGHMVDWTAEPYSLITSALESADLYKQAKADSDTTEKEAADHAKELLRPFCRARGTHAITGSVWDSRSLTKEAVGLAGLSFAGAIGGASRGLANKFIPDEKIEVQKRVENLEDRGHESTLQGIRTKAMLHDMMANDPVVSGYSPDQVFEAFNRISEVAPRAAQHRLVVQQLMRKYLEQASVVDPFEVDQLLNVETKLQQRDSPLLTPSATPQAQATADVIS